MCRARVGSPRRLVVLPLEREDDYSIPDCRMQRCGVDIALPRGRSNRFMQKRRALPRLLRAPRLAIRDSRSMLASGDGCN